MIVVSDTSPIRALAHLGHLDLLPSLFADVLVPPAVVRELSVPRRRLPAIDVAILPFARIVAPSDVAGVNDLANDLGPGESEAIVLAREVRADHILIDERAGRAIAESLGLRPLGVLGVLVRGKAAGLIHTVSPLIDRLQSQIGFFISDDVRAAILRDAGE